MQRSIATVSVAGTLPEKLHAIADAGFRGVEIFEPDLEKYKGNARDIARLAASLDLQILLYQPFRNFEGMPAENTAANLERARRTFDVMHQLDCEQLLLCSNVDKLSFADPDRQISDLAKMAALAQQHGIKIGFEALAWGRHIHRYSAAWERVKAVDNPAFGLVLDSFHVLSLGDELKLCGIPLEKIFFVQLADAPRKNLDVQEWSRHFRCFPGTGDLPVLGFARTLVDKGYRGPWSLEIFNDAYQAAPAGETALAGFRSLQRLEEQLGKPA
ncbi:sugar phosphate isomerase/epimerase [Cedecea colo]|uniref:Sugar phosphate isomerase/epimerase n=1 Tax=Cedecea colo TaxID=2552946 RepID=A0ABX0VGH1_9ENTR|nr:sugar phosphate isomerase/epimerase [Cedecea colo]